MSFSTTWADLSGAGGPRQAPGGESAADRNILYLSNDCGNLPADMDIFWSIFAMPIGVTLCFGPAMVVWWLTKGDKPGNDHSDKGH
jgi:hypothetical protein